MIKLLDTISEYLFTHTPLIWFVQSYWRDEAFSILLSQKPVNELLWLTARDFSPPAYYLILKVWMFVFGSSEIATRSFSLLCFALTLFVCVEFLVHIAKWKPLRAALVILIFGVSAPLLVYYGFESRGYTLLALCSITASYAFYTRCRRMYIISMSMGLLTHYTMLYILIAHVAIVFLIKNDLKRYLSYTYVPLCIFFVWMWYMVYARLDMHVPSSFWIPHPTLTDLFSSVAILLTGHEQTFYFSYFPLKFSVTVLVLIALVTVLRWRTQKLIWQIALLVFLPVIIIYIQSILLPISLYLPRYLIVATPHLIVLLALIISQLKKPFAWIVACFIMTHLFSYMQLAVKDRLKDTIRTTLTTARLTAKPDDLLLTHSELHFHTAQYYWTNPTKVKILGKTYDEIPSYVGKVLIPPESVVDRIPYCGSCTIYILDDMLQLKRITKLL